MLSNKSEFREAVGVWAENQDGDDCDAQPRLHLCGENGGRLADTNWSKTAVVNCISDSKRKPHIRRRHFIHNIDYLKQVLICESIFTYTSPNLDLSELQWRNRLARGTYTAVYVRVMPRLWVRASPGACFLPFMVSVSFHCNAFFSPL